MCVCVCVPTLIDQDLNASSLILLAPFLTLTVSPLLFILNSCTCITTNCLSCVGSMNDSPIWTLLILILFIQRRYQGGIMCRIAKPLIGQFCLHLWVTWPCVLYDPSYGKPTLIADYSISLQCSTLIIIIRWYTLYFSRLSWTFCSVSLLFKTFDCLPYMKQAMQRELKATK